MVWRRCAAVLLAAAMILVPALAGARAGGSYRVGGGSAFSSIGSRGAQTYSFNGAAPIQRSVTPQTGPTTPYGAAPGYRGAGMMGSGLHTGGFGGNPRHGELIVGGDAQHPTEASEMWTFARSPGGRWLLSAIQQI